MLTFLIGAILFLFNPTAGAVGLIALALHGSYFLAYAITWGVEVVLGILAYLAIGVATVAGLAKRR